MENAIAISAVIGIGYALLIGIPAHKSETKKRRLVMQARIQEAEDMKAELLRHFPQADRNA